jgi:hypothetical protein
MTEQLQAQIGQLSLQVDTQEATIKRLWCEKAQLTKERDYWRYEAERQATKKPSEEDIQEVIFGGQG